MTMFLGDGDDVKDKVCGEKILRNIEVICQSGQQITSLTTPRLNCAAFSCIAQHHCSAQHCKSVEYRIKKMPDLNSAMMKKVFQHKCSGAQPEPKVVIPTWSLSVICSESLFFFGYQVFQKIKRFSLTPCPAIRISASILLYHIYFTKKVKNDFQIQMNNFSRRDQ